MRASRAPRHRRAERTRRGLAAAALGAALWGTACQAALHLMFPYDYLSLSDEQRRIYILGVLDARLAPLGSSERLDWLTRCLVAEGLTRVRHVVETEVIPAPESAVIPMPYLVERALHVVCSEHRK